MKQEDDSISKKNDTSKLSNKLKKSNTNTLPSSSESENSDKESNILDNVVEELNFITQDQKPFFPEAQDQKPIDHEKIKIEATPSKEDGGDDNSLQFGLPPVVQDQDRNSGTDVFNQGSGEMLENES